ncbi:hypothetical protein RvY_16150 [Ramazzottius varieornatus]|uniref:Raptor N-terminal CASPase-like domain-containing protein n=1 Tax=Ramazzottius varieornatus TaxID=947166 RepID=A0A1D1W1X9_RAMVA|nr:hypothetical protein RvY_16150 [Ramazzottius varieornatus]
MNADQDGDPLPNGGVDVKLPANRPAYAQDPSQLPLQALQNLYLSTGTVQLPTFNVQHPSNAAPSALQSRISVLVSEGQTDAIDWQTPLAFTQQRHTEKIQGYQNPVESWRVKDRMKTVSVALVLCLNVGVDPPDVVKPSPCARLEAWVDPLANSSVKAVEKIGDALQKQYERWQPRARYKQSLDPTIDDIKKLCVGMRKSSKDERVLFHYNGHGVPKPTANGEIWVFNKNYTQYIPLSVYDMQLWMGVPSLYVYDCSNAGMIVESFLQFANSHQEEYEYQRKNFPDEQKEVPPQYRSCIHLASCASGEELPTNPLLPADLFTACLTTPIKMALLWYTLHNTTRLLPEITLEMIDKIPGQMNDRRTMLGELNWIFTAVTDTIAWNSLPRELFHRLFRQDLLVASLFRNFLLAERVMRSYKCSPISYPNIPHSTAQHPMWDAWDFALDACLCQLPAVLEGAPYIYSTFFTEQLTAFQVWLTYGNEKRHPPEQLPIVLQVLLSQSHRLRALDLLGRFVDLGPWAVNQALSVGIFPYVLKLLQSSARELRPLLVFIWAKILAVDDTCQGEIIREGGHKYFVDILADTYLPVEHRTMAAFVMSRTVADNAAGKDVGLKDNVIAVCLEQITEGRGMLRQWVAITLGVIWTKYPAARWAAVRDSAYEKLYPLLKDRVPEVRAAAIFALGTFVGNDADRSDHANAIDSAIGMQLCSVAANEASPLVRMDLVVALQWLVLHFEPQFTAVAYQFEEEEKVRESMGLPITSIRDSDSPVNNRSPDNLAATVLRKAASKPSLSFSSGSIRHGNVFQNVWKVLMNAAKDPYPEVAQAAQTVVHHIKSILIQRETSSPAGRSTPDAGIAGSPKTNHLMGDGDSPPTPGGNLRPPANRLNSQVSMESRKSTGSSNDSALTLGYSQKYFRSRRQFDPGPNEEEGEDEGVVTNIEPLVTSEYVQWAGKTFALPMIKLRDDQDPTAERHFRREWKYIRNRSARNTTSIDSQNLGALKYDTQMFFNRNPEVPSHVVFDPVEAVIYVADRSHITIWNYKKSFRVGSFFNGNVRPHRITDMELINAHDAPLLLVATDEGSLRVWKNISAAEKTREDLVTGWQALPEILSTPSTSTPSAGLIFSWEALTQHVIVAGDCKTMRIWDTANESKVLDIATKVDSGVGCVASEPGCRGLFVAGYGDGSVRLYDRRLPATEAQVMVFDGHLTPVVATRMPPNVLNNKIYSASTDGDVKLWDARMPNPLLVIKTVPGLSCVDFHSRAELFCCGSTAQTANIYSFVGTALGSIRHYEGFMGQRIGPVASVAFHPYKATLAVASTDSFVSVYSGLSDKKFIRQ